MYLYVCMNLYLLSIKWKCKIEDVMMKMSVWKIW